MALSNSQVQELHKSPQNKALISKAADHEQRLRFHVETAMDSAEVTRSVNRFLETVAALLPKDKYMTFLALFKFPIGTNDLTEQIFHSLEKIFDGRNPFKNYNFVSPEAGDDWAEYKAQFLSGDAIWQTVGWEKMKSAINSVLVVDLKRNGEDGQTSPRPEPYFYWRDIDSLHDLGECKGEIEYVMYKNDSNELIVIDDLSYRVFTVNGAEVSQMPVVESFHELGYCPARFFWTSALRDEVKALKKSPLSNQLAYLDKLLFAMISKEHLDLYAAYPIYWAYESDCDYQHPETGDYCHNGFIKTDTGDYMINREGTVSKCPMCSNKRLTGAGSFIEVPLPNASEDVPDLKNPIGIISIDKDSLAYNRDEVIRKQTEIYTNVVGFGGDLPNDQAVNKLQIAASFESRTNVLLSLKRNFEIAQKWTEETICRLRYGELFRDASISYGTEFYLYSPVELLELYKKAKESGVSVSGLDSIQDQLIETEHRNDPISLNRARMLTHLEPYRHMTRDQVINGFKANPSLFNEQEVYLKIKFSNFVTRFERENLPIVEFGGALSFDKRIQKIKQTLINYGDKERSEQGQLEEKPAQE